MLVISQNQKLGQCLLSMTSNSLRLINEKPPAEPQIQFSTIEALSNLIKKAASELIRDPCNHY